MDERVEPEDVAAEGADVTAAALIDHLAAAMQARLVQWNRGAGFVGIRAAWLARAHGLAQPETIGCFETIDDAGRLMLRVRNGGLVPVAAGEVFPFDRIA